MEFQTLIYQKEQNILTLTLNRPPANAFSLAALNELESAIEMAESDRDTRVVIVTGAGEKCFSAGFDVSDAANGAEAGPKGRSVWTKIDRLTKPVIAAINGYAFGGGCELAMSTDKNLLFKAQSIQKKSPMSIV